MTAKKKETSLEQNTKTGEAAEYLPSTENNSYLLSNREIKNLTVDQSKNAVQLCSPIDEQPKSLFSYLYLPSAAPDRDNIWKTPMTDITDLLTMSGVPSDQMQISLITLLILSSAHLGNPISLELIDDSYAGADNILRICTGLTPDNFLLNFSRKLIFNDILTEKDRIKGRSIVGFDSIEFEKVKNKINLLLKNQRLIDELTLSSKVGSHPIRIEITGPTSCVLITNNPKKLILTDPSFLRCYLQPSSQSISYVSELSQQDQAKLKVYSNFMKNNLERLQHQKITIPYRDNIIKYLEKTKIARDKVETLLRMLRVITIINNSPPLNGIELLSNYSKSDLTTVATAFGNSIVPPTELTATKVDYYIFWILMSGFIQNEDTYLTENQKRIFEVIKKHNEKGLATLTMNDPNDSKYEKLNLIAADNSPAQITQEQIFIEINKNGGDEIKSKDTLYKYIQELLKIGLIGVKKYSGLNKYGYYVTTWEMTDTVKLPHPSEIDHPVMKNKIKIRNPLTGEIDEV